MLRINPFSAAEDRPRSTRPSLVRFLLINAGIGALVAVGVVAALILTDAHAIGRLILADQSPAIAIALLLFGFVITLGSAAMGAAIMGLPYGNDDGSAGRRAVQDGAAARLKGPAPKPLPVRVHD